MTINEMEELSQLVETWKNDECNFECYMAYRECAEVLELFLRRCIDNE